MSDGPPPDARTAGLVGIFGAAYVDLEDALSDHLGEPLGPLLDAVDREVPRGLVRVPREYTGGSLKWMGVVAPWVHDDGYVDYGHVLAAMDEDDFREFVALGPEPERFDPALRASYRFGDETDHPLTPEQARFLEYRHGVYFPWKVVHHLVENDRWDDKHSGQGKGFSDASRAAFPRTCALVERLPFVEVGRALVFGLLANDHAPAHRDSEPGQALEVAQSISLDPRGDKGFYLVDGENRRRTPVTARAYWFNDMDFHGVEVRPRFQYSLRVDGRFEPAFAATLERRARRARRTPR